MLHLCDRTGPPDTVLTMHCGRTFAVGRPCAAPPGRNPRDPYAAACPSCLLLGIPPPEEGCLWFDDGYVVPYFDMDCVQHARITDPETSHADGPAPLTAQLLHRAIWRFLAYVGPRTDPEIAVFLRGAYGPRGPHGGRPVESTLRGARKDLYRNGLVRQGGRTNNPGRQSYRWDATPPDQVAATRLYHLRYVTARLPRRIAVWQRLLTWMLEEAAVLQAWVAPWVNPWEQRMPTAEEEEPDLP